MAFGTLRRLLSEEDGFKAMSAALAEVFENGHEWLLRRASPEAARNEYYRWVKSRDRANWRIAIMRDRGPLRRPLFALAALVMTIP